MRNYRSQWFPARYPMCWWEMVSGRGRLGSADQFGYRAGSPKSDIEEDFVAERAAPSENHEASRLI